MPESLGKTLQRVRESKKLSIEEVSERTRIPTKIISNIEENRLHEFSSVFYARSFVKTYSQFLGALEEKTVKDFLASEPKKDTPELILKREGLPWDKFLKYKRSIGIGLVAIFALWILLFSFIKISSFIRNVSKKHKAQIVRKKEAKEAIVAAPSHGAKEADEGAATTQSKKIEVIELEISARYNTWIQVTSDGELLFRGILKKKKSDIWRAKKKISLKLGNAGGVSLILNGKSLGYPGKKGEKKEIIVTKDGIK